MTFDQTFFGWGLGLVISGWIAGMVVGFIFKVFSKLEFL